MKLTFIGTRGEVRERSSRHNMHSSMLVDYRGCRLMIDCGYDWLGQVGRLRPRPRAIIITHAHPDHAWGLKEGAPCPVYASAETWDILAGYPVRERRVLPPRRLASAGTIGFEAFPVEHSTRAPAVGYRVAAGRVSIFYAPDLVYIHERAAALAGCRVYAGDGATLSRSLVRKRGDALVGHAPMRTQLTWCRKEGVPRALFTHCGSPIVSGDEENIIRQLSEFAAERRVEAQLAYDGMELILR